MSYDSTNDGPTGEVIPNGANPTEGSSNAAETASAVTKTSTSRQEQGHSSDSNNNSDLESEPLLRQRLLSPDDPKVSPLNLYQVRLIKFIVWVLWIVNGIAFFVLLLSDFISIPGLNNRGRSFLEIDLIILSALTNLLTLWCFVVPAYYERVLGYIISALLGIDLVVVLSVTYLRHQFGFIGNFLILWSLGTVLLNCYADFIVERGKKYQEIRYTGRPETRKTFREAIVISLKFIIKLVFLVAFWNISLSIWLQAFDTHVKPDGDMVPVNNEQFKVHLSCYGDTANGTQPIILVEGGQTVSSEDFLVWIEELYNLNKIERYCIWDRPGYGFSDSAPSPISVTIVIDYLSEALLKKGIEGPFVPVGFDIGGLYSRAFAAKNPAAISSLMLVDSWHEDLLKLRPFPKAETYSFPEFDFMTTKVGFKLWFKGLISPLGIVPNLHWFLHPKKYSSKSRIFGVDMVHQSQYLRARLQEQITSLILSYNEVAGSSIRSIPLYVISSDYLIKRSKNWGNWQRLLTKLSDITQEWTIVEKANHFIWESSTGKKALQDALLRVVEDNK